MTSRTDSNSNTEANNTGQSRNWLLQLIIQVIVIQVFFSFIKGNKKDSLEPGSGVNLIKYKNYLAPNDIFDLYCYITNKDNDILENLGSDGKLVYSRENQIYTHKFNQPFDITKIEYKPNNGFIKNVSEKLYFTVVLVPHKSYKQKMAPFYNSIFNDGFDGHIIQKTVPLTTMRRIKKSKAVSLMGNINEEDEYESNEEFKHWIPRIDINIVYDTNMYAPNQSDAIFAGYTKQHHQRIYYPLLYLSQFWILEEDYLCIKPDIHVDKLFLSIHYSTCSPAYYAMSHQIKINSETGGVFGNQTAREFEMLKRTLMTTNIYMLIFSGAFILLHTVFSFFALKNDIQFWHQNDSMEGLSALSVIINFFCDIIIALYIFDSENTSWLILVEFGIGVLASAWKVSKAVKIRFKRNYPFVHFECANNYVESNTKKYDEIAIKYMSIVMAPCIVGYAIYSLYYEKHKSWYSYIISVAAGSVYTFGFIMMTPQVYINYKLKSVDHLPWKALIYKSLNTFVDDVASFLIDMPWMHRLSCFRDDIIFFCYLYQRWAYRVDHSRPNAWTHSLPPEERTKQSQGDKSQTTNVTQLVTTEHEPGAMKRL